MTTNHEFQAGEYSPRAGRRVCVVCNETQGSKFHSVRNSNGDEIFHGVTAEGEVFGIEVTDTPAAEVEDQGYSEWIDLLESEVYVNAEARVHRDFSSQSGVQGFVGVHEQTCAHESLYRRMGEWVNDVRPVMCHKCGDNLPDETRVTPEPIEGQDAARGILAVNPEPEGSDIWHAWGLGFEYAEQTGGVYDSPLSGEWADSPTPHAIVAKVMRLMGFETSDCEEGQDTEIAEAFELGYATYVAGWRI